MIGIFDSGLGGLTVLKQIKKVLPDYNYHYLGDTLHVPFGNRSDEAIFELTRNACDYLFSKGCKIIIIACNTASAKALRKIQMEYLPNKRKEFDYEINVLGVVIPLAEYFAKKSKGKVGVIGTRATVNSNVYELELNKLNPELKVFQTVTPLLVPLIEEGFLNRKETKSILRMYLKELKKKQVDSLILGCTHYPLLINQIKGIMGKRCFVPHPGEIVAKALKVYLEKHQEFELVKNKKMIFEVTDLNNNFKKIANSFFDHKIEINKTEVSEIRSKN